MSSTRIYRLVPTASLDDSNWERAAWQGDIVVRARSSGEARAIAARAEALAAGASKTTTQVMASALRDPLLYGVRNENSGRFPGEGPLGVLSGAFQTPPDYLVTHED